MHIRKALWGFSLVFFVLVSVYGAALAGETYIGTAERHENEKPLEWGQEVTGVVTRFDPGGKQMVALTFDACGGGRGTGFDSDLVAFLRRERIPATLFINARWIASNPKLFSDLASDKLFEIANHGYAHKPLSVSGRAAYGIAGTKNALEAAWEIEGGAKAIEKASGRRPRFFRSGTNHYDEVAVKLAGELGHKVIGYSINGDGGATFSARQVSDQLLSAKPGDIVLMHMNRPDGETAEGVIVAIPLLRENGMLFATLSDVQ
ncbi:MAG: polysaccharide deacetylase family protein [Thermovirgaceae bacterium]|nr:polysaccharide deacetylase family protein [Thermovirgaceae bacterium]